MFLAPLSRSRPGLERASGEFANRVRDLGSAIPSHPVSGSRDYPELRRGDRRMQPTRVGRRKMPVPFAPENERRAGDPLVDFRQGSQFSLISGAHFGDESAHLGLAEALPEIRTQLLGKANAVRQQGP